MRPNIVQLLIVSLLVALPACKERKHANPDGEVPGDSSVPDTIVGPPIDGAAPAVDTGRLDTGGMVSPVDTSPDLPTPDLPSPGTDVPVLPDVPPSDILTLADLPADLPVPDTLPPPPPDVAPDLPTDKPPVATDTPADLGPDVVVTTPDAPGTCSSSADCTGICQTCNASRVCVPAVSQADPNGRCLGTCDATGACKSKKGQSCQTVAAGCESGTTCSPDGICCDQACSASCMACDISGSLGTCTPVASGNPHGSRAACTAGEAACDGSCAGKADGTCSYPTKACTGVVTCSGTDRLASQFACASGKCQVSSYQTCSGGFACSGSACKTSCVSSADCQSGYYCYNQSCHAKVVSVATGGTHTCAALADGRVVCWGGDYAAGHMLGDGVVHTSPVANPVQVSGMSTAKVVRASNAATCALTSAGTVFCWGDGDHGELGTGTNTPASGQTSYWKNTPVQVITSTGAALAGATDLYAGGGSFCAQTSAQILCWGDNSGGVLGFDTASYPAAILSATPLPGATTASSFTMGYAYQLAVTGSTVLHAWGDNRSSGLVVSDLASGNVYPSYSGQNVSLSSAISQVSAGAWQACLLLANGYVQCWGDNFYGGLGNGGTTDDPIPGHRTGSGISFVATRLACGTDFVCAQTSDASNVVCWGDNGTGVISSNTSNNKIVLPTTVALGLPIGLTVAEVVTAATSSHVCAVISDGSLMCWGRGDFMQTGTGQTTTATTPAFVKANW
jgi:alpha-tubulin suppressor-like RCC1 family protein